MSSYGRQKNQPISTNPPKKSKKGLMIGLIIGGIILLIIIVVIVVLLVRKKPATNPPTPPTTCTLKPPTDAEANIALNPDRTHIFWTNIPGTSGVVINLTDNAGATHTYEQTFPAPVNGTDVIEIFTAYSLYVPPLTGTPLNARVALKNNCGTGSFSNSIPF